MYMYSKYAKTQQPWFCWLGFATYLINPLDARFASLVLRTCIILNQLRVDQSVNSYSMQLLSYRVGTPNTQYCMHYVALMYKLHDCWHSMPTCHLSSKKMCKPIVDLWVQPTFNSLCRTVGIYIVIRIMMPKHTSCMHSPCTVSFSPQLPQVLPHKMCMCK